MKCILERNAEILQRISVGEYVNAIMPAKTRGEYLMPLSDEEFCQLCRTGLYDEIKAALDDGAFVNASINIPRQGFFSQLTSFFRRAKRKTTTPLLEAAANNPNASTVELLCDYGADPTKANSEGLSPLDAALNAGRIGNALAILRVCRDDDGSLRDMAMIHAAQNGDNYAVKELIRLGANLDARNHDGNTALMLAVMGGHSDTANIIIDAGGENLSCKDEALIKAVSCTKPDLNLITKILDWGADAGKAASYARENRALMGTEILRRIIRESRG